MSAYVEKFGIPVKLDSLSSEEAIAIVGLPVWKVLQDPWHAAPGAFRVLDVNRETATITLTWEPADVQTQPE